MISHDDQPRAVTPIDDDAAEHLVAAYDEAVEPSSAQTTAGMSDPDLLIAYQRTTGAPGDPEADALLAEIARRGLDI